MNRYLDRLQPYPFQRLSALLADVTPAQEPIRLSIGEPRHAAPEAALVALQGGLDGVGRYPATKGTEALRAACAAWATRRYSLPEGALDPATMVVPCNGTREAIFALVQAAVDGAPTTDGPPLVAMPNPFYQIYEGAALLAGAEPLYVPCRAETGWTPDWDALPEAAWRRCRLALLCTPHNPTGGISSAESIARLLERADACDFAVASDECYSEIYAGDAPPPGLLEVCAQTGRTDFARCAIFQSLSKRSSLPGLRSGFVAGGAALMQPYLLYRTYSGGAVPLHVQAASVAAWSDEAHVAENRALYQAKIDAVVPLLAEALDVHRPAGGFFLWARVPGGDGPAFARALYAATGVEVLPGSYLARAAGGEDPGAGRVRIALVAPQATCVTAAERIVSFARTFTEAPA